MTLSWHYLHPLLRTLVIEQYCYRIPHSIPVSTYEAMDPASAIISIASFGFTVFNKFNELRRTIKGAPEQIRALQDSCVVVELLIQKLRVVEMPSTGTIYSAEDLACLEVLCDRARQRLEDVERAIRRVAVHSPGRGSRIGLKIRVAKWILNKDGFEEISKKLNETRDALWTMLDFIQFHYVQFLVIRRQNNDNHSTICLAYHRSFPSISSRYTRHNGTLRCSHDCACRCHAPFLAPIVPQVAVPYIGQIFVSNQLLYPPFTRWSCCNVETCRGTSLDVAKASWVAPRMPFHGSLHTSLRGRIHLSINAYRTVSYSSPIIQAIWNADLQAVRDLFAHQRASIWDVDIAGNSIFWHACTEWQEDQSEAQLGVIRFLVEAGADALLFARTNETYSAHDILTLGLLRCFLERPYLGRSESLAISIQINPTAISIFRSILNTEPIDALEDLLSRWGHSDQDISVLLTSLESTEYIVTRATVFKAIQYTPLAYALYFSPTSVNSLLAEGADAAAEPILAYAAHYTRVDLIESLISSGAVVNMKDRRGRTALHWACYGCHYNTLVELLRCAGDIVDWSARTPEGYYALDLLEMGLEEGNICDLTSTEIDELRSIIISHKGCNQLDIHGDEYLYIPGAFPLDS